MENINNITFADQDLIDQHPEIQAEFMREIFKLEPNDYMVTDASTLSDFATCGVELENPPEDYALRVAAWDKVRWCRSLLKIVLPCE